MIQGEDGEGTVPELAGPGAAVVSYIVYGLSHC